MTIKRQYSLPNCRLILEGLNNDVNLTSPTSNSVVSILVNVECHFVNSGKVFHGGRVFLEHLLASVSTYTQQMLSSIPHPQPQQQNEDQIHLEKMDNSTYLHRLTWLSNPDNPETKSEVILTTVQLFDLMEAVDQFFADSLTLPELTLNLQPVSRRYRQREEPLVEQAIPAALGLTSVALMATAVYFIPVPEVRKPEPKYPVNPTQTTPVSPTNPDNTLPPPPQPQPITPQQPSQSP